MQQTSFNRVHRELGLRFSEGYYGDISDNRSGEVEATLHASVMNNIRIQTGWRSTRPQVNSLGFRLGLGLGLGFE